MEAYGSSSSGGGGGDELDLNLNKMVCRRSGEAEKATHTCHDKKTGPVAILWDIENCPVPVDVRPDSVAGNVRTALRCHPVIGGAVTMFSAYGDFNAFPRRLREGCQRTGVKLVDVPNGRKDAADKAILIDMFLFVLDNPPPCSIMLISGDVDFSPALHVLGQRGYTVVLAVPSGRVSSALMNAGAFVWDWPTVARGGDGFDSSPASAFDNDGVGDHLGGLKTRMVSLLERSGGVLPLSQVHSEYQKAFGRPLWIADYKVKKLSLLLQKMVDSMVVQGEGVDKYVRLRSSGRADVIRIVVEEQDRHLREFKHQLQEILVSYSCRIFLSSFDSVYQQRYGKPVDLARFGVRELEELLHKVGDVVVLREEHVSRRKFLSPLT